MQNLNIFTFIIFVFGACGCAQLIIESYIFEPFRNWIKQMFPSTIVDGTTKKSWIYYLITCYSCLGFWLGIFFAILLFTYNPIILLLCGGFISFFNTFLAATLDFLQKKS
jgi:hypothetical protein